MSNIEKIRQEIERRIENYWSDGDVDSVVVSGELEELIDFIDSLPEETCKDSLQVIETCKENTDSFTDDLNAEIEMQWDSFNKHLAGYIEESEEVVWLDWNDFNEVVKDAFIAGTKWQANQFLKGSPLPEDSVAFNNGVKEGKRLLMEEAIEGEIGYWNQRGLSIRLDKSLERLGYDMDTKVKIVIVKEDDRPRD